MYPYQINPMNHASIVGDFTPDVAECDSVKILVMVSCNGVEGEVTVTWNRDYPKVDYPEAKSEWECPHFDMPVWDASAGDNPRADRMRMYECLLDVTDQYFYLFIKGK